MRGEGPLPSLHVILVAFTLASFCRSMEGYRVFPAEVGMPTPQVSRIFKKVDPLVWDPNY